MHRKKIDLSMEIVAETSRKPCSVGYMVKSEAAL